MGIAGRLIDFFRGWTGRSQPPPPQPITAESASITVPRKKTGEQRREEIEIFVRNIVSRIEGSAAMGITTPDAIAAHFNETGVTTRKGRGWTPETVEKFLSSPGAKRYRTKPIIGR